MILLDCLSLSSVAGVEITFGIGHDQTFLPDDRTFEVLSKHLSGHDFLMSVKM